jgi:hypothetical protein
MIPPPPSGSYNFNPPPGWPPPPPDWVPPTIPWDADPSLPPAPENWQWWKGSTPYPSTPYPVAQQGNSISAWWRRQTRMLKILIGTGIVFVLAALLLPHSSWFASWRNTVTGEKYDVSELHAFCSDALAQALSAKQCTSAGNLSTFFTFLLWVGIALLVVAAYKVRSARLHRSGIQQV